MRQEERNVGLTEDEILQILKLIEASHFDELHLEMGDLKLTVSKHGRANGAQNRPLPVAPAEATESKKSVSMAEEREGKNLIQTAEPEVAATVEESLVPIKAPLLGMFYQSPEPGAPPYVSIGTFVKEDDTVCLLEVMKVFNAVKAGVQGYVVKACVENGQLVEYGQTLFLIKPLDRVPEKYP